VKGWARAVSLCFAAGAAGALATWILGDLAARVGWAHRIRFALAPAFAGGMLFRRLVFGGVFGQLLLLPFPPAQWVRRGLVIGLVPAGVQLLVVFPYVRGHGFFGLDLGLEMPFVVLFWSAVWGVAASWWHKLTQ